MATRAQVETLLVRRCGRLMTRVGLDGSTTDGTNASLSDPISTALLKMGITPADLTSPTSAEVAQIEDEYLDELLVRSELRALQNIEGNWDKPDAQHGINQQDWGELLKVIQAKIRKLEDQIEEDFEDDYIEGGTIRLDFQQDDD